MTLTISISQFRQNIADYIAKAQAGHTVIVKDEKKDQEIVELVGKKQFDPEAFEKSLRAAAGIFTEKNHPEWKTKKDVSNWVKRSRKAADRKF